MCLLCLGLFCFHVVLLIFFFLMLPAYLLTCMFYFISLPRLFFFLSLSFSCSPKSLSCWRSCFCIFFPSTHQESDFSCCSNRLSRLFPIKHDWRPTQGRWTCVNGRVSAFSVLFYFFCNNHVAGGWVVSVRKKHKALRQDISRDAQRLGLELLPCLLGWLVVLGWSVCKLCRTCLKCGSFNVIINTKKKYSN